MKSTCKQTWYCRWAQDNNLCYQSQQHHVQTSTGQTLGLFCNDFSPFLSNPSLSSLLPFSCFINSLGFSFLMLYSLKPLRTCTTEEKEPSHLQRGSFLLHSYAISWRYHISSEVSDHIQQEATPESRTCSYLGLCKTPKFIFYLLVLKQTHRAKRQITALGKSLPSEWPSKLHPY